MHEEISSKAIDILKNLEEVDKIILYGSVLRGDYNKNSDIDLAFICDDVMKSFPLNLDGTPVGLREKIQNSLCGLEEKSGIKFHVPIYWESDFREGITFPGKKNYPNTLLEAGCVVFDSYKF